MLRRSALASKGPAPCGRRSSPTAAAVDQKLAARREKTAAEDRLRRLRQLDKWAAEDARGRGLAVLASRWRTAARDIFDALREHVGRAAGERPPWAGGGPDPAAMGTRALMCALLGFSDRRSLDPLGDSFFSESEESDCALSSDDEPCAKRHCGD